MPAAMLPLPGDDSPQRRTWRFSRIRWLTFRCSGNTTALHCALLELPIRYREVIVLCDLQELSYADAARALGCAVGTGRSRLHRGRAMLARRLCDREDNQVFHCRPRDH